MSVDTVKGGYDELLVTAILVPFGKMAELMLLVRVEELLKEDNGKLEVKLFFPMSCPTVKMKTD